MNNDLCIIPLKTEYTTNVATGEKSQLLHAASDSLPRFKVYTRRKDSVIGHLILSKAAIRMIAEAQEIAKINDYETIRMTDINLPGLSVMWDIDNCWVEASSDYERQAIRQLLGDSIDVRQSSVQFAAEGEYSIEESDTSCWVRFTWSIADAIRDWLNRAGLSEPSIYSDEEFKHLQDAE